eukprot:2119430-Amphidinium_carterae.2
MKDAAVKMASAHGCAVLLKGGSKWRFAREEAENVLAFESQCVEVSECARSEQQPARHVGPSQWGQSHSHFSNFVLLLIGLIIDKGAVA